MLERHENVKMLTSVQTLKRANVIPKRSVTTLTGRTSVAVLVAIGAMEETAQISMSVPLMRQTIVIQMLFATIPMDPTSVVVKLDTRGMEGIVQLSSLAVYQLVEQMRAAWKLVRVLCANAIQDSRVMDMYVQISMNVVMGQTLVTRIQNALTLQEVMFVDAFRDFLVMVIHVKTLTSVQPLKQMIVVPMLCATTRTAPTSVCVPVDIKAMVETVQISTNVPTLEQTNALLTHCAPTTRDLTPVAAGKDT